MAAGAKVWLQVEDSDAWALATVQEKFGGSVHLLRSTAPKGVSKEVSVTDEAFAELVPTQATGEEDVDDLVTLSEINSGTLLCTLRTPTAAEAAANNDRGGRKKPKGELEAALKQAGKADGVK